MYHAEDDGEDDERRRRTQRRMQDDAFRHLPLRARFLDRQQDDGRRRSHRHPGRRGGPRRTQPDDQQREEVDEKEGQRDVTERPAQQVAVVDQPAHVEPPSDFEHQEAKRGVGDRPDLRQRLDADPAEKRRAEEGAGQHVADHLRPAEAGAHPFADQQSDNEQQAEQGQRIEAIRKRRDEEQPFLNSLPTRSR